MVENKENINNGNGSKYETLKGARPLNVSMSTGYSYIVQHRRRKQKSSGTVFETLNLICTFDGMGAPRFANVCVLPKDMNNDDWKNLKAAYDTVNGEAKKVE